MHDPHRERALAAAEALLYHTIERVDPATGEKTERRVETPLHRDYLKHRAAYEAAKVAYAAAHAEAQKTERGRGTWPMLGANLQLPVQLAQRRWRSAGADQVEEALALLERAAAAAK